MYAVSLSLSVWVCTVHTAHFFVVLLKRHISANLFIELLLLYSSSFGLISTWARVFHSLLRRWANCICLILFGSAVLLLSYSFQELVNRFFPRLFINCQLVGLENNRSRPTPTNTQRQQRRRRRQQRQWRRRRRRPIKCENSCFFHMAWPDSIDTQNHFWSTALLSLLSLFVLICVRIFHNVGARIGVK